MNFASCSKNRDDFLTDLPRPLGEEGSGPINWHGVGQVNRIMKTEKHQLTHYNPVITHIFTRYLQGKRKDFGKPGDVVYRGPVNQGFTASNKD